MIGPLEEQTSAHRVVASSTRLERSNAEVCAVSNRCRSPRVTGVTGVVSLDTIGSIGEWRGARTAIVVPAAKRRAARRDYWLAATFFLCSSAPAPVAGTVSFSSGVPLKTLNASASPPMNDGL